MTEVREVTDRFMDFHDLTEQDLVELDQQELERLAREFFDPEAPESADPGLTQRRLDVTERGAALNQAEQLSESYSTNFGVAGIETLVVRDSDGTFTGQSVERGDLRKRRVDFGSYVGEQLYNAETGEIITQRKVADS